MTPLVQYNDDVVFIHQGFQMGGCLIICLYPICLVFVVFGTVCRISGPLFANASMKTISSMTSLDKPIAPESWYQLTPIPLDCVVGFKT